jgi:RHS repeat-associated protein
MRFYELVRLYAASVARLWTLVSLILLGPELLAVCTPTVSASISGDKITMTGSITASCSSRTITLLFDGAWVGDETCGFGSAPCTITREISTNCKKAGNHTVTALGDCYEIVNGSCRAGTRGSKSTTVTIEGLPTVSIDGTEPDANGLVDGTLSWYLPRTGYQQGTAEWWVVSPTNVVSNYHNPRVDAPTETTRIFFGTDCWAPGTYQIRARVKTCGGDVANATAPLVVPPHKPTASIEQHPTNKNQVIVTWSFPHTGDSSQRYVRLDWMPDGSKIWETGRDVLRTGKEVVTLPACLPEKRDSLRVVAVGCGNDTFESEIKHMLPACETSCGCESESLKSPSNALSIMSGLEPPSSPNCAGNPVRVTSGNMRLFDHDPLPGSLVAPLGRVYDSLKPVGRFGNGWVTIFDAWLKGVSSGRDVMIGTEGGDRVVFRLENGTYRQVWPTAQSVYGSLRYDAAAGEYLHRDPAQGVVRVFRGGKLVALRPLGTANQVTITYDAAGTPQRVSDSRGTWAWIVTVGTNGKVASIAVEGHADLLWSYAYNTAGNLTSVASTAGVWRTYTYGTGGLLTARDGGGRLIESHQYDASKRATTSVGDAGDITSIAYDQPGRVAGETRSRVTYASGRTTDYYSRYIGGKMRTVQIDGSCDCGSEDAVYAFNTEGRLTRQQNALGYISEREFTGGRVVRETTHLAPAGCDPKTDPAHCRLTPDALLTALLTPQPESQNVSYVYGDPNWHDRPTSISTASVLVPTATASEEYTYDAVTGVVLESRLTGWTGDPAVQQTRKTLTSLYDGIEAAAFNPGGAFDAWAALPQPIGQVKGVDGPRTDVSDTTTYVYYPVDATVPPLLRGRLAATRNAAGHVTRFEAYDIFGNTTRVVDPNGVATESTHDSLGRLTFTTLRGVAGCDTTADPLCHTDITTERHYDGTGPIAHEITTAGVTSYTYDDRRRIKTISRGPSATDLRERIEYTYDPASGRKSVERTLAFENGTWVEKKRETYTYDASDHLSAVMYPDGKSVGYQYGAGSRLVSVRDENHTQPNTFYEYDGASRIKEVRQTLATASGGSITTRYDYDRNGNLTSVTDSNGNVTSYVYDDFGQMLRQESPVTGITTYAYDAAGNLTSSIDARGGTTTRTYDAAGRVTAATSAHPDAGTESVTWSYDNAVTGHFGIGRMTAMSDPSGSTLYAYDRRGLLRRETKTYIDSATFTTTYTHDAAGRRASLTYPSGRVVEWAYDFAGRPYSAASGSTQYVTSATYWPFGPLTQLVYGNGMTRTMTYDARYRPTLNRLTGPAGTIAGYTYEHDGTGNITQISDTVDAAYNRTFAYDDLGRLVTANSGAALWGNGSYTYDRMGNMLTAVLGSQQRTFTYQGTSPKVQTAPGLTTPMTYDAAGNELDSPAGSASDGSSAIGYSARNLVATQFLREYDRCDQPGQACGLPDFVQVQQSNLYDGRGVRVMSVETEVSSTIGMNDPPPVDHYYFYTPELEMLNVAAPSTGRTADVIWFGSHPVADHGPSELRYTFTDHLGTPILQTTPTASIVWRVEHEPYGQIYTTRTGIADDQPLRFAGQQVAHTTPAGEETYNIFRWYRSGWGRYSSADPLLTSAIDFTHFPIETNPATQPYSYAAGNPIQYVDPLGLYVAPGPIIDACVKTKNPQVIAGGVVVALMIVAANSYGDVQPGKPKPYKSPCDACHDKEDDDDNGCDAQLADEKARCFNWWGGSKKNYSKLKACNQSAMWRWFECKKDGVPHTPLSPTPFQY